MQDDILLAGSIAENITLFDEQPDDKKIYKLLQKCRLDDLINTLPMGLNTFIGELGAQLSGGANPTYSFSKSTLSATSHSIFR